MSRRVLVVDDEELIRWSLVERLRADGHEIWEAGTAAEALERADEGPDLVLLDYKLPDADGLSVLKKLRELDPDVLVMMLTAHRSVELVVEAMKAGAYDYATKPFDLDDVAIRVQRALETTRLRRELKTLRNALSALQPPADHRRVGGHDKVKARAEDRDQPRVHRADYRGERDRQRSGGEGHPLHQQPRRATLPQHHLLGAARSPARVGALRARARRLHGRAHAEARPARTGR
jgi:DNA-binding response OmpR family regulator